MSGLITGHSELGTQVPKPVPELVTRCLSAGENVLLVAVPSTLISFYFSGGKVGK